MAEPYRRFVTTDGTELWDRIDRAQQRFAALVHEVGADQRVVGSPWTAVRRW